ncbi:nitroreductase family protein [Aquabacterium sp.]|uniref:nitroreductase family protein n=1 Tax=Aquabacterium sp. TaxID=1872578 RepID=UPI002C8CD986|nr:nitroreductase [Aquabacterium sp.]HSW07209.1 nitroreductase [Aquabacterium sp.]
MSGHDAWPAGLALLLSRQSVGIKHLAEPGPDAAQLRLMADAALRAPDHAGLVPFRFAVVQGAARERLAQLFAQVARDAGKDEASVALDVERAQRAPVTVAVLARLDSGHPQVPVHEQWACVGGALTNLLNAAHALGFAGKMLSGAKVRHPAVQQAFCRPGETLLGWVALGTPVKSPQRGLDKPRAVDVLSDWDAGVRGALPT